MRLTITDFLIVQTRAMCGDHTSNCCSRTMCPEYQHIYHNEFLCSIEIRQTEQRLNYGPHTHTHHTAFENAIGNWCCFSFTCDLYRNQFHFIECKEKNFCLTKNCARTPITHEVWVYKVQNNQFIRQFAKYVLPYVCVEPINILVQLTAAWNCRIRISNVI